MSSKEDDVIRVLLKLEQLRIEALKKYKECCLDPLEQIVKNIEVILKEIK